MLFPHIHCRKIVSSLVANNMHEVLLHNDQLAWNMARGLVLQNFTGTLTFTIVWYSIHGYVPWMILF